MPDCAVCSKWLPKPKQVDSMALDYLPEKDQIAIRIGCHGDNQEVRFARQKLMKHNQLIVRVAFAPGQASRINGQLVVEK